MLSADRKESITPKKLPFLHPIRHRLLMPLSNDILHRPLPQKPACFIAEFLLAYIVEDIETKRICVIIHDVQSTHRQAAQFGKLIVDEDIISVASPNTGDLLTATKTQILLWRGLASPKPILIPEVILKVEADVLEAKRDMELFSTKQFIRFIKISPDKLHVFVAYGNGLLQKIHIKTKEIVCAWAIDGDIGGFDFNEQGDVILIRNNKPQGEVNTRSADILLCSDMKNNNSLMDEVIKVEVGNCYYHEIISLPQHRAVITDGDKIYFYDMTHRKLIKSLDHFFEVRALTLSPDNQFLLVSDWANLKMICINTYEVIKSEELVLWTSLPAWNPWNHRLILKNDHFDYIDFGIHELMNALINAFNGEPNLISIALEYLFGIIPKNLITKPSLNAAQPKLYGHFFHSAPFTLDQTFHQLSSAFLDAKDEAAKIEYSVGLIDFMLDDRVSALQLNHLLKTQYQLDDQKYFGLEILLKLFSLYVNRYLNGLSERGEPRFVEFNMLDYLYHIFAKLPDVSLANKKDDLSLSIPVRIFREFLLTDPHSSVYLFKKAPGSKILLNYNHNLYCLTLELKSLCDVKLGDDEIDDKAENEAAKTPETTFKFHLSDVLYDRRINHFKRDFNKAKYAMEDSLRENESVFQTVMDLICNDLISPLLPLVNSAPSGAHLHSLLVDCQLQLKKYRLDNFPTLEKDLRGIFIKCQNINDDIQQRSTEPVKKRKTIDEAFMKLFQALYLIMTFCQRIQNLIYDDYKVETKKTMTRK